MKENGGHFKHLNKYLKTLLFVNMWGLKVNTNSKNIEILMKRVGASNTLELKVALYVNMLGELIKDFHN